MTNIGSPVNSSACSEKSPDESSDGLELYFHRQQCTDPNDVGLWFARRTKVTDPWGTPQPVLDTSGHIVFGAQPSISSNKMSLYYTSNIDSNQFDVYYAARVPGTDQWTPQGKVPGGVNTLDFDERSPSISGDDLILYFCVRPCPDGDDDIFRSFRLLSTEPFGVRTRDISLSTVDADDLAADISSDNNFMVFTRQVMLVGIDEDDITTDGVYLATRDLGPPVVWPPRWCVPYKITISDVSSALDKSPCIWGGAERIHFGSDRSGGQGKRDIWVMNGNCNPE